MTFKKISFHLVKILIWSFLYFVMLTLIQSLPLIAAGIKLHKSTNFPLPLPILICLNGLACLATCLYYTKLSTKNYLIIQKTKFDKRGWLNFSTGFLLGTCLIAILFYTLYSTNLITTVINPLFSFKTGVDSLLLFLFVAITEEVFCRGIILNYLLKSLMNRPLAILASSTIFALFHTLNPNLTPTAFLNIFLSGMLLAMLFIYTNYSLLISIGLHWSWNFFQSSIFGFPLSGKKLPGLLLQTSTTPSNLLNNANFGLEGSILTLLTLILTILIIYKTKNTNFFTKLKYPSKSTRSI